MNRINEIIRELKCVNEIKKSDRSLSKNKINTK